MRMFEPESAECLSGIWAALHDAEPLTIQADEVQYLRMLAVAADDDLASTLLLQKLRMARIATRDACPPGLVTMNSFLEYSVDDGAPSFCQLRHPSADAPPYARSVVSLIGAGLIGLRIGQSVLWPNEEGVLRLLRVLHVENCPSVSDWISEAVSQPVPMRCV